jgi:hypothetical protein
MSDRIDILDSALELINQYTTAASWRPGLVDLCTYDCIQTLQVQHQDDAAAAQSMGGLPDYIWKKTPKEIMQIIIDTNEIFDLEQGWEYFADSIRDYLIINGFIIDTTDLDEDRGDVLESISEEV